MITAKLDRTIEFMLFVILIIFPFSFEKIDIKWEIIFCMVISFLVLIIFSKKYRYLEKFSLPTFYSALFLLVFNFSESINFSQLFSLRNIYDWCLPLSTVVLSVAIIVFAIKLLYEKNITIEVPRFIKYLIMSCAFLIVLTILFYPFLYHCYRIGPESNILMLNKLIKYMAFLVLVISYTKNKDHFMRLNIGFVVSIGLGVLLHIFF